MIVTTHKMPQHQSSKVVGPLLYANRQEVYAKLFNKTPELAKNSHNVKNMQLQGGGAKNDWK